MSPMPESSFPCIPLYDNPLPIGLENGQNWLSRIATHAYLKLYNWFNERPMNQTETHSLTLNFDTYEQKYNMKLD